MTAMMIAISGIILPVLLLPLISFVWVKMGRPFDTRFTGEISLYVGSPALIFSGLTRVEQPLAALSTMMLAATLAILAFGVIGYIFLRVANLPQRTYLTSLMFPNMGNIGLPICYFAFGEQGLALAVACMVTMGILTFSVGMFITGGRSAITDVFKLPNLYALAAALAFLLTDTDVPTWLANASGLMADFTIPLMLLTLGAAIANMRISKPLPTLYVSALRFILGATVGWSIGEAFNMDPLAHAVLIVECMMPVAVYTFVLAQRYHAGEDQVASTILASTLASLIILPLTLLVLLPTL